MLRVTSKLLCSMVWGATVWGFVVIIFAYSRLDVNFKFSKDLSADYHAKPVERVSRETFAELPAHVGRYAHQVFASAQAGGADSLDSMCTMVMLTYNRETVLKFLLSHYCKVRSLHKIIVIWNNVNKSIPNDVLELREKKCIPDLLFIQEKENKLTNRFKPRPEIETNCVCIMDDDRFIIDLRDLEFGFTVWQNFRHRIVGFEHRTHIQLENGSFWYDLTDFSKPRRNYSMILTSTAILHKAYLQMFFDDDVLPKGMIEYIDERKNCEDIGINVMVAKFLMDLGQRQAAALAIKARRGIKNMEGSTKKSGYTGLSSLPDHYIERSQCLDDFRDMYGGELPLPYATFIMENMMTIPRRNISRYRELTRNASHSFNASRSYFMRTHNRTYAMKSLNTSHHQRTYNPFLAQRSQYNSSHHPYPLKPNKMIHSVRSNNTSYKIKTYQSRPLNVTQLRRQHHNTHQEPIKGGHSTYFNATQLQRPYHQTYQKPLEREARLKHFNVTQLQRQKLKPQLELQ